MKRPIITLLTDFGTSDHYVGAMKGVILGICPQAQLVDISHEVTPYAITEAAFTLEQARRCFLPKTVHLVVVDPGVGSTRRPILAEAGGHYFVAPDNGVLSMVLDADPKHRIREITADRWFRKPVSQTFHGRDIFAPVAAHLASGVTPAKFGKRIKDCLRLNYSKPTQTPENNSTGVVIKVDRFGNIVTNFDQSYSPRLAAEPFRIQIGAKAVTRIFPSYSAGPAGKPFAIWGSSGFLEISCKQQNAAEELEVAPGSAVLLQIGRKNH
jgi:S-adenosylmethionine hydrolase